MIGRLEKQQNYGMRIILDRPPLSSTQQIRDRLEWTTLEEHREYFQLVMMNRCMRGEAPSELRKLFSTNEDTRVRCAAIIRGTKNHFLKQIHTEYGRRSFSFAASKAWNNLPRHIKEIENKGRQSALRQIFVSQILSNQLIYLLIVYVLCLHHLLVSLSSNCNPFFKLLCKLLHIHVFMFNPRLFSIYGLTYVSSFITITVL